MDLEQTAIERLRMTSDMSLRLYKQPLVITYSGGKDSDVLLHLAGAAGIPYEVLHSLTTADAPETVWHVRETFRRLELNGRTVLNTLGLGTIRPEDIGKTVFLTREEAEKALQEMEGKA